MLGPLRIHWDGATLALPASRKVRALFAYPALAPLPVSRSQLCEVLWDVPNDPRGELRWCLSKIRSLVDDAIARRDPNLTFNIETWLAMHRDARARRRVRLLFDHLARGLTVYVKGES